ncbi:hypothetical protein AC578_8488 [Pseudocercospora eumusae]|uniref:Secreted protein n=1 Tax=Pseudocercospora eumusae TaxID=321146 RepID=A0A139HW94_9PEZI|nr:hypothetical protein AC578_8488 [Pseudocercospora eumusae]
MRLLAIVWATRRSIAMIVMVHTILRNVLSNYGEGMVVTWHGMRARIAHEAVPICAKAWQTRGAQTCHHQPASQIDAECSEVATRTTPEATDLDSHHAQYSVHRCYLNERALNFAPAPVDPFNHEIETCHESTSTLIDERERLLDAFPPLHPHSGLSLSPVESVRTHTVNKA